MDKNSSIPKVLHVLWYHARSTRYVRQLIEQPLQVKFTLGNVVCGRLVSARRWMGHICHRFAINKACAEDKLTFFTNMVYIYMAISPKPQSALKPITARVN